MTDPRELIYAVADTETTGVDYQRDWAEARVCEPGGYGQDQC
jgi:hypothetical protein